MLADAKAESAGAPPASRFALAVASYAFDPDIPNPEALLDRYHAMTGWADAVVRAGASVVTVVQRFSRDALIRRGAVEYRLIADDAPGFVPSWFWRSKVTRVITDLGPDAVHVDGFVFPALVGRLRLSLPRRTAIVVQDHGGVRLKPGIVRSRARRLLYGFGLGAADAFMFTAREQATPWLDAGVIRSRHTVHEVLESSTDMGSWPLVADSKPSLPGDPAILWVGRLEENKDPLTVLDGFARALPSMPAAALTMVYGDDLLLPAVKAWISARPELESRIHLRGPVERRALPAFYAGADIFVLGSHREVACFSLIEALSLGVTPVVTDIPAFRAITGGGRVGALFPAGDAGALGLALARTGREDLSRAARRSSVRAHFERELSWAAVGRRALAVYRSAAAARLGMTQRDR
jgi:glycosyltransferase involved in cell wall biosynthesis